MSEPTIAQVASAVGAVLAGLAEATSRSSAVFPGRVLGQRQAEAIEAGRSEIHVGPGTIITPLGLEVLKARRIEVQRVVQEEPSAARIEGEWGFAIDVETGTTAAVRRNLREGSKTWVEVGRDVCEAVSWVAQAPHRGAALLAGEASVAAWRANGVRGVRAAVACEADDVLRAVRSLGVNLLVIEPAGKSIPWIGHLLTALRRGGIPKMPDGLVRGRLPAEDCDEDRRGHRPGHALPSPSGPAERALRDRLAHAAPGPGRRLLGPW